MGTSRNQLMLAAQALCDDFAARKDIDTLLSHFSKSHQCSAIEYGEPSLAPFLGRHFIGILAIRSYFEQLVELLTYEKMHFSEYIVDVENHKVSVKGQATFTWIKTAQSWDETFTYSLDFDDELKVTDYQVWADSGAVYLARLGKLDNLKKEDDSLP